MSVENINKMYDELYKSQVGEIEKAKNKALQELETQKTDRTKDFYNQENRVAQDNAVSTQRIRDYMANRNLLNSGENVDAMLRSNTDFSNAKGGIADARNSYFKEYDTNKHNVNNNYNLDVNKLKAETEFKKKQEILAYQEKLRQEALAAQRAYSGGSGGFGGSGEYTEKEISDALNNDFQSAMRSLNMNDVTASMARIDSAYRQGYISDTDYNSWYGNLKLQYDLLQRSEIKSNKGLYGYSGPHNANKQPVYASKYDELYQRYGR